MKKIIKNTKGSSLTMVLAIMMIMMVLSMGIISNSMNNLKVSEIVSESERSYYAAKDSTQVAISTIKNEVSQYYMLMQRSTSYAVYQSLYSNFFNYLSGRLTGESSVLDSPVFINTQLAGTTSVTCFMDTPTTQSSGVLGTTFHVTSTTTIDGIARSVSGDLVVEAAPIFFQYSTAPKKLSAMLVLLGDVDFEREGNENALTVVGTARIGGGLTDPTAFGATLPIINDPTVDEDLEWQMFYNQFDKSIANPTLPPVVIPTGTPGAGQLLASVGYVFTEDTLIENQPDLSDLIIYCDGNLTITGTAIRRCNIYATGNVTINSAEFSHSGSNKEFEQNNVYAGQALTINAVNINSTINRYYYAGTNMNFTTGDEGGWFGFGADGGNVGNAYCTAGGNIYMTSIKSPSWLAGLFSDDATITQSQFYASGSITTGHDDYMGDPRINVISNCTFETGGGTITLVIRNTDGYNKVHSRGNLRIANVSSDNSEYYADGTLLIDSSDYFLAGLFDETSNTVFASNSTLTLNMMSLRNCYLYTGSDLDIFLSTGNTVEDSIFYAEDDILYSNEWNIFMNTMESSLMYCNGDFEFSGRGSDLQLMNWQLAPNVGAQVMSRGDLRSYEGDDSDYSGWLLSWISTPERDLLRFGDNDEDNPNDMMNLDIIHDNIGDTNVITGVLADELDSYGFEHQLSDPIIVLPYYTEVFLSENYN